MGPGSDLQRLAKPQDERLSAAEQHLGPADTTAKRRVLTWGSAAEEPTLEPVSRHLALWGSAGSILGCFPAVLSSEMGSSFECSIELQF